MHLLAAPKAVDLGLSLVHEEEVSRQVSNGNTVLNCFQDGRQLFALPPRPSSPELERPARSSPVVVPR
jgi:hypothetical protein